jgi:hypothetical protein
MSAESLSPRLLRNYWLDVALLLGFLAVFITGELRDRWHQGLAVALGAGLAVHVVWHWPALKRLPVTLLGHGGPRSRAHAAVDLPLVVILVLTLASGLIASPWLTASPDHSWVGRHHVLPKLMLVGVIVHLALHQAWIAWATRWILGRHSRW